MTLQNLLRIGKLKDHAPTAAEVLRLLAAVDRNLADAAVSEVSDETRFDAAYKAVMQCSLAAMMASGYRPIGFMADLAGKPENASILIAACAMNTRA